MFKEYYQHAYKLTAEADLIIINIISAQLSATTKDDILILTI